MIMSYLIIALVFISFNLKAQDRIVFQLQLIHKVKLFIFSPTQIMLMAALTLTIFYPN